MPAARPMRGRAIFDPVRVATSNSVASKHGALIKVNGHLVPRCECCDCKIACAFPKYDFLACGPCTPRNLKAAVAGVNLCDCTYLEDPPRDTGIGIWGKTAGDVTGVHCVSPGGASPIFSAGPCIYYTLLSATSEYFLEADGCGGIAAGASAYCYLFIEADGSGGMIRARIRTGGGSGPFPSEAEIFWSEQAFAGWEKTYIFSNRLNGCGLWPSESSGDPFLEGTWILGKNGTIVVTACCN